MNTRLFVGGLPWAAGDRELSEAFQSFGTVTDAKVILDRETGKSRGFGFVTFSTEAEARAALEGMNGGEMAGRRVTVKEAQDRGPRGPGPGGPPRRSGPPPDRPAWTERPGRPDRADRADTRGPDGPPRGPGFGGPGGPPRGPGFGGPPRGPSGPPRGPGFGGAPGGPPPADRFPPGEDPDRGRKQRAKKKKEGAGRGRGFDEDGADAARGDGKKRKGRARKGGRAEDYEDFSSDDW